MIRGHFSYRNLGNPIVEIELAFRFKKDLELGADMETIIAAIESVAGAVEVPNPNYQKPEHFNGLNFIAHSVVSKCLLLGGMDFLQRDPRLERTGGRLNETGWGADIF